ncbi:threonine/serine exporter ThrE family protein [Mycobacterium sp. DBP42]|uniref:threonine/serine ThrE exporter family protein n=1 Tax=Mycobacterium sp. DBP42 TaxID=2545267 RepID=UPI00110C9C93|nr:threonine/serine exporter family protein [Mycobacterium sp. DBP42]TMS52746.1 threonine/serine exporter family protein [Mycobacterium sp. DBP42]
MPRSDNPTHEDSTDSALSIDFIARLGTAMLGADYPIPVVRHTLERFADKKQIDCPLLVLPNFVQAGDRHQTRVVRRDSPLRYDQTFPLGELVTRAERGQVDPADGLAELDRIHSLPRRYPGWVEVLGYGLQSAAYALILQPTLVSLVVAAGFGLLVGIMELVTRGNTALRHLLPVLSAFAVTYIAFSLGRLLHMGHDSLRVLIAPLTLFLPGVAITLAVIESSTGEVVSGSARLMAGFTRLAQLALGIVIAVQLLGLSWSELVDTQVNTLGGWAPWLGVAVYAVGIALHFGPPPGFMPWLTLVLFIAYGAQALTAAVFGGYTSGFGGGLILMICALALSRLPNMPAAQVVLAPGFWLLVPSSVGMIGIADMAAGQGTGAITVMLVSMMSIALGFTTGFAIWNVFRRRGDDVEFVD